MYKRLYQIQFSTCQGRTLGIKYQKLKTFGIFLSWILKLEKFGNYLFP